MSGPLSYAELAAATNFSFLRGASHPSEMVDRARRMVHLAGDWWVERRTMPRERLVDYLAGLLWHGMRGWGEVQRALADQRDAGPERGDRAD